MCPSQRSKKRNALIGVFVEPEVKAEVERTAAAKGMTVADYLRSLLASQKTNTDEKKNDNN